MHSLLNCSTVTCHDCLKTQHVFMPFQYWLNVWSCPPPVAVSPGDQLLHPEKKKTKAERDAEGDEVDSPHADREHICSDSVKLTGSVISSELDPGGYLPSCIP